MSDEGVDLLNPLLKNLIVLTDDEKRKVIALWNGRPNDPPSIKEICAAIWPDKKIDARDNHAKAVKKFLSDKNIKFKEAKNRSAVPKVELTQEQKEFIEANCSQMGVKELTRTAFDRPSLNVGSKECVAVMEFLKTLNHKKFLENPEVYKTGQYLPPSTNAATIARVNKYVHNGIHPSNVTPKQKRDLLSLMNYLHTMRFRMQMDAYPTVQEQELFESEFIKCTYDKGDLTEEEVDQYIVYSFEVVNSFNIQRDLARLKDRMNDDLDDEDGVLRKTHVEEMESMRQDLNNSLARQEKLLAALKVKRSDRLKNHQNSGMNLNTLVEMWKDEETRKRMIKMADKRKELLSKTFADYASMDELKAKIMGISEEEILNG